MAKFKFVEWLLLWLQETSHFEFDWDEGNQTKSSAKHAVTTVETEEVFLLGQVAPLGVQISPKVTEERSARDQPTRRRGNFMKTTYVKARKEYNAVSDFEKKKILAAAKRLKTRRKLPTSVALEEETIEELKALAQWRGIPYQVLMRMFILDGLHKSLHLGRR